VLLAAGLVALVAAPLRDADHDLDSLAQNLRAQRTITEQQLALLEHQSELVAKLVALQTTTLQEVRAGRRNGDQIDAKTARLLVLTRKILDELREMNRKTGGDLPG
jgi:hypothetical protein